MLHIEVCLFLNDKLQRKGIQYMIKVDFSLQIRMFRKVSICKGIVVL